MEYQKDKSEQQYLEVSFGWDSDARLRLTYISKNHSVRINKLVPGEAPYPGPEPEITKIPIIIEALAKIYNDFSE
jgi:hypothetical protein